MPQSNPKLLWIKEERSRLDRCWRRWKSLFDRMKFRAECNSVRSLISKAESFFPILYLNQMPILAHPGTNKSNANPRTPWKPMNHMPILAHPENPSIQFSIKILQTYFLGPILTNLVNLSLSGGFFIVIQTSSCPASFH